MQQKTKINKKIFILKTEVLKCHSTSSIQGFDDFAGSLKSPKLGGK